MEHARIHSLRTRTHTHARLLTLRACRCAPLRTAVRRPRSALCVLLCPARCRRYHEDGRARRRHRRRRHPARGVHRARAWQGASSHSRLSALLLPFTRCHSTHCSTRHTLALPRSARAPPTPPPPTRPRPPSPRPPSPSPSAPRCVPPRLPRSLRSLRAVQHPVSPPAQVLAAALKAMAPQPAEVSPPARSAVACHWAVCVQPRWAIATALFAFPRRSACSRYATARAGSCARAHTAAGCRASSST